MGLFGRSRTLGTSGRIVLAVERNIALTPSLVNGEVVGGQDVSITGNASVPCPSCPVP